MLGFTISAAGLIAGAVVAPALVAANPSANAAWIAALSGFGGATNLLSDNLQSHGLSGTYDAQSRNNMIERIREHLRTVFDGSKGREAQLAAISQAKAECYLYLITVPSHTQIPSKENN
ncbi:hypothetical protein [Modicisalibacter luteus]|uniref:hypothetical protein n=1 Tax=Modicisalibacter luteus TaxID=453962 RepID=UPI003631A0B2